MSLESDHFESEVPIALCVLRCLADPVPLVRCRILASQQFPYPICQYTQLPQQPPLSFLTWIHPGAFLLRHSAKRPHSPLSDLEALLITLALGPRAPIRIPADAAL